MGNKFIRSFTMFSLFILIHTFGVNIDTFLQFIIATCAIVGLIVSAQGIKNSNKNLSKQLEIEQKPFVIIVQRINPDNMTIKNIGRGIANRITFFLSNKPEEKIIPAEYVFDGRSEGHSIYLGAGSEQEVSINFNNILNHIVKDEKDESENVTIYTRYMDQLNNQYNYGIHLAKDEGGNLKVMEIYPLPKMQI